LKKKTRHLKLNCTSRTYWWNNWRNYKWYNFIRRR
jgi:hypothetical protein